MSETGVPGWQKYLSADLPTPTDADRARIEAEIGHRLPDAYWQVITAHQGDMPDPSTVSVEGRDVDVGVFLYVIDRDAFPGRRGRGYGLLTAWGTLDGHWPKELVPFTDDTGGNQLAFDYRAGNEPRIVKIDHETPGEAGIRPVADSFATLLRALGG